MMILILTGLSIGILFMFFRLFKKKSEKRVKFLTTHEIIDEIANLYTLENRSVGSSGNCLYNGPGGKRCAFARMCISLENLPEDTSAIAILEKEGVDILKPEYRGHEYQFYQEIQYFHDNYWNWTDKGLSDKGKEKVIELKKKWPVE